MKRTMNVTATALVALLTLIGAIAAGPRTATAAGSIYACVNNSSGTIHIVGATASCASNEMRLVWGGQDQVTALEQAVTTLQGQVASLQTALAAANATIACLHMAPSGVDLIVEGCNLHVRSGGGATDAAVNGLGNLIVGYDETFFVFGNPVSIKTGSHNLIIGRQHTYTSYGGLVAGQTNFITGPSASITGGRVNTASGDQSSVSGGFGNTASGNLSSVSGGNGNTASGPHASVSGGLSRSAISSESWAAGSLLEPN